MTYGNRSYHRGRGSNNQRNYTQQKGFHHAPLNTTKQYKKEGTIISGLPDAIFIRNKYQTELDNAHASVVNMVHYVEEGNNKLKEAFNKAESLKRNIQARETERQRLYESLGNLLNKETNFEEGMWKNTLDKTKVKSVTVKQKFKDTDIDEIRYDAMNDFLQRYPEYASKSTFKTINENIKLKEKEIREEKSYFNKSVSDYNYLLSQVEKHTVKAEDKIAFYHKILDEGQKKLSECRYVKSIYYKLATEETKAKVNLDTLQHRIEQFTHTLDLIKSEFTNAQRKSFEEMKYE
jgi:hypothetical protein